MSQFIDEVEIEVASGDGGDGIIAWRREKYEPLGGPAGGDGGRGGHIYLQATHDINTLLDFRYQKSYQGMHGKRGGSKNMSGKSAKELIVKVPVGTVITDLDTNLPVADLVKTGQRVMVAEGGRGGRGNASMASQRRTAPHFCEPGQAGIKRRLKLELKLLADVGIVGLPNAGKSTLLSSLTRAKPKIAGYPFTTLVPNLGVAQLPAGDGFVLADVPGLIEGAADGAGLGHRFLKHLERTSILVHMVDITSDDIARDINTINRELQLYSDVHGRDDKKLSQLPQVMSISKIDLVDEETLAMRKAELEEQFKDVPLHFLSAATGEGTRELINVLAETLDLYKREKLESEGVEGDEILELTPDIGSTLRIDEGYDVIRKNNVFSVVGDRVDRIVSVTNLKDPESLDHMFRIFRAMGIIDTLLAQEIQPGMDVIAGGVVFTYGEDWS